MTVFWAIERDAELSVLVKSGRSFSQIAKIMGFTKNKVIGRAWRMNLAPDEDAPFLTKQQRAIVSAKARRALMKQTPSRKPIIEFPPPGRCVFPHGDPREEGYGYCGDRIAGIGLPYCDRHMMVAYQPAPERKLVA